MEKMTDERREQLKGEILDAFFSFRSPEPVEGYKSENRTTAELQDELNDMYGFTMEEIAGYMVSDGYIPTTEADGSVRWAIWRMLVVTT